LLYRSVRGGGAGLGAHVVPIFTHHGFVRPLEAISDVLKRTNDMDNSSVDFLDALNYMGI